MGCEVAALGWVRERGLCNEGLWDLAGRGYRYDGERGEGEIYTVRWELWMGKIFANNGICSRDGSATDAD